MLTTPYQRATSGEAPAPPAAPVSTPGRGWRRAWRSAAVAWVASHLAYLGITVVAWQTGGSQIYGSMLDSWLQWDGWHYWAVATKGYVASPQDAGFFPLYPLLYRLLDPVLPGGLLVSALVVSNVAGLGALVMLHRLIAEEFGEAVGARTVYYLVAFPTAYFLAAPYNHSLFLVFAIAFLYALRQQRWWLAGMFGAFASGTRSVGVLLVVPFVYEYLRRRDFRPGRVRFDAAAVALVPAGAAAFAAYCWYALGDPLAYTHVQVGQWDKIVTWPGHTLWLAVEQLTQRPLAENYALAADLVATLAVIAALVACLVGRWKVRPEQRYLVVYAGSILLLPLCLPGLQGNPVISMTRYLLDVAVIFLVLGRFGASRTFERLYLLPAVALQCGYLFMYLRAVWTF